ncbi:MAG: hypothetical protein N2116_02285, partial [Armatimonadetes bacterium]|nr:hypothetical protein [Armatimonadota bacterium]
MRKNGGKFLSPTIIFELVSPLPSYCLREEGELEMAQVVFIAVDLGAESGRVLAGKLTEGKFELEEIHRFPNGPIRIGEHIYWDVLR